MPMVKRRLVRFGAIAVFPLLALMLSSCVGGLPVTVTSVTGTLQAYNPAIASGGIPSERVDFTVGDYAYGSTNPLVCLIDVYQNGVMVGTDTRHNRIGSWNRDGWRGPRIGCGRDQFAVTLQWHPS